MTGDSVVLWFADAANRLGAAARSAHLQVPAFRCPRRDQGRPVRSVRRYPGGAVVQVWLHDGDRHRAARDMVVGVLIVNGLADDDPVAAGLLQAVDR